MLIHSPQEKKTDLTNRYYRQIYIKCIIMHYFIENWDNQAGLLVWKKRNLVKS